ncbi:hypothetical protein [Faunimonas pinastri]|uniref:hypothetical protein n=1 Tax=Faunimonas pinastri TaxID=1855383 RepID=UPI00115FBDF1|nr:hypothetical protein [Faunimonas pinastri]
MPTEGMNGEGLITNSGTAQSETMLAAPPIPSLDGLRECQEGSNTEDEFQSCVVERALPRSYRTTEKCLEDNDEDRVRALACSTGGKRFTEIYDKVTNLKKCVDKAHSNTDRAVCVADPFMNEDQRYYLACLTQNKDSLSAAMVCAIARNATPEQQIALGCAIDTKMEPHAYVVCTGGKLLERELGKCLEHGIGTDDGCFGPNNDFVKLLHQRDDMIKHALGENSVAYQALKTIEDPFGLRGKTVEALNNGLHDLQHGPGPGNDIYKVEKAVGDIFKPVTHFKLF